MFYESGLFNLQLRQSHKCFFLENYYAPVCNKSALCIFAIQNVKMMYTQMLRFNINLMQIIILTAWSSSFLSETSTLFGCEWWWRASTVGDIALCHAEAPAVLATITFAPSTQMSTCIKDKQHLSVIMKTVVTSLAS